jgi:hypothetical protein
MSILNQIKSQLPTTTPTTTTNMPQITSTTDTAVSQADSFQPAFSEARAPISAITERQLQAPQTVAGQMKSLLSSDSPYIKQAQNSALRQASSRGLINTSMAAGAGQAAAIQSALPIAQQDAQQSFQNKQQYDAYRQNLNQAEQQYGMTKSLAGQQGNIQAGLNTQGYKQQTGLIGTQTAAQKDLAQQGYGFDIGRFGEQNRIAQEQMRLQTSLGTDQQSTLMGLEDRYQQGMARLQTQLEKDLMGARTVEERKLIQDKFNNDSKLLAQQTTEQSTLMGLEDEYRQGMAVLQTNLEKSLLTARTTEEKELLREKFRNDSAMLDKQTFEQMKLAQQGYNFDIGRLGAQTVAQKDINAQQNKAQMDNILVEQFGLNERMAMEQDWRTQVANLEAVAKDRAAVAETALRLEERASQDIIALYNNTSLDKTAKEAAIKGVLDRRNYALNITQSVWGVQFTSNPGKDLRDSRVAPTSPWDGVTEPAVLINQIHNRVSGRASTLVKENNYDQSVSPTGKYLDQFRSNLLTY